MADQEKFHYQIPETDSPSPWDGLSQPAREALGAAAAGSAPAADLLPEGSGQAAEVGLSPEVKNWANPALEKALERWSVYDAPLIDAPASLQELVSGHKSYAETITRLFKAQEALRESGETNSYDENIGETMELILVPWQDFRDNLPNLKQWMDILRDEQGAHMYDKWSEDVRDTLKNNGILYRNPQAPAASTTPKIYLDQKIDTDGPWGIMLAQTNTPGIKGLEYSSPDQLTNSGRGNFQRAGHNVDGMGVFEWLSLTLQIDSREHEFDYGEAWLLANRARRPDDKESYVCVGRKKPGYNEMNVSFYKSSQKAEVVSLGPRLAVL